ncbi:sensor histidine kinase [Flavobacterium proteolyticum]|nr:histidine kinase [Flavobacterium proteolyticum]
MHNHKSILLLLLIVTYNLSGQNPYFNKIDKSTGLPSNTIYDITQDQKGFMWFATNEGVCKYDGVSFSNLSTKKVTSKAGSSLVVDNNNTIYYCNFDGYIYYNKNEILEPVPQNQPLGYSPIGILNNKILTTEKNNIIVYDINDLKIIKKFAFNHNTFVTSTRGDNCYYILSDCLYKIDQNLKIEKIKLPEELNNISEAKLLKYGNGKLYFFNKYRQSYFIFEKGSFKKHYLPIPENIIQNIAFVDNQIWLCTTNGIFKLNDKNDVEHWFKNHNISYFFKDSFQNYWISTLNEGLFLIPNLNTKLYQFPETISQFDFLEDKLLIGTVNNSIYSFDLTLHKQQKIHKDLDNHEIYLLKKVNDYFFATSSQFRVYNNKTKLILEKKVAVKNIIPIDHKYFGVAASGFCGILCFDTKLKSEWDTFYNIRKKEKDVLNEARIESNIKAKSIAYNPVNKTIYISTNLGVITQTFHEKKTLFYKNKPLYINHLNTWKNYIFGVNANGSLIQIDNQNKIKTIPITSEEINKIKIIRNHLFIITKKNILLYNLSNKTKIEILTNNQEFDVTDIGELNNQILFATKKGMIAQNLEDINLIHNQKFILNHITINDVDYSQLPKTLSFDQNNIKFNFSVLNFSTSYSNAISYKINNNKWYTLENNSRKLILNELSPGTYQLEFRVYNPSIQKYDLLSYTFEIKPPFWKTPLFLSALLAFIFILCYLVFKNHVKKINLRNKEKLEKVNLENELNKSRLTAIKSQMNPHFFFNALNTIQSYILTRDNKKALYYLKKFSVLTRNILETSEKEYISLEDEIKTLELYLEIEKARFNENEFFFNIETQISTQKESIKVPAMLLQPFIENAVKHGLLHKNGIKKIAIQFNQHKEYLTISIEDNGIGRKKSQELNLLKRGNHISFATEALMKRIEILNLNQNKKISIQYTDIEDSLESGTIVTIQIPI